MLIIDGTERRNLNGRYNGKLRYVVNYNGRECPLRLKEFRYLIAFALYRKFEINDGWCNRNLVDPTAQDNYHKTLYNTRISLGSKEVIVSDNCSNYRLTPPPDQIEFIISNLPDTGDYDIDNMIKDIKEMHDIMGRKRKFATEEERQKEIRKYQKKYREANREKAKATASAYYLKNRKSEAQKSDYVAPKKIDVTTTDLQDMSLGHFLKSFDRIIAGECKLIGVR